MAADSVSAAEPSGRPRRAEGDLAAGALDSVRSFAAVWWLVILAGVLGVVAGIIVLAVPSIGLITLAVVAGIFLLVDGISEIFASLFEAREHRGLLALVGVVSAIIGVLLIRHPIAGVVAVALLLGFWLLTLGIVRLVEAFSAEHRLLWIVVAVVEIVAGIVILSAPGIGVGTLAILVGIAFILRGVAMCALGWTLRSVRGKLG